MESEHARPSTGDTATHCTDALLAGSFCVSLGATTIRVRFAGKRWARHAGNFSKICGCSSTGVRMDARAGWLFRRPSRPSGKCSRRDGPTRWHSDAAADGLLLAEPGSCCSLLAAQARDSSRLNLVGSLPRDASLPTPLSMHTASQCKIGKPSGLTCSIPARLLPSVNTRAMLPSFGAAIHHCFNNVISNVPRSFCVCVCVHAIMLRSGANKRQRQR